MFALILGIKSSIGFNSDKYFQIKNVTAIGVIKKIIDINLTTITIKKFRKF